MRGFVIVASTLAGLIPQLAASAFASGEVSLASEDTVESIQAGDARYTVVRDATDPDQWYYVPPGPALVRRGSGKESAPDLTLLRYSFADPHSPTQEVSGGYLQFAISMDIPSEAQTAIRAFLVDHKRMSEKSGRLSALPITSGEIALYTKEGALVTSSGSSSNVLPTFADQKVVFALHLTNAGADFFDALVNSPSGVPVSCAFKYGGLTAPAGFKITVNWKQIHKYYSEHTDFAAKASYFGLATASYEEERQKIIKELRDTGALDIQVIEGSNFKLDQIGPYLQPILNRINSEIVELTKPPENEAPAKASKAKAEGVFFGVAYSVAIKSLDETRSMTETIRFDVRSHQERISRADGTIGLAGWSDEIKKQCITVVKLGPWEKALFVLPNDLARPECNVRDATLTVHLQHHDDDGGWRDLTTQAFTWRPDRGWSNADTPTLGAYLFATMGYKARYPNEVNDDRLRFLVEARITAGGQAVTAKKELALFNGQSSLADVEDLFDLVGFDPRGLQWALDAQHGGVDKVDVSVVADDKAYTASLSPVDGDKGARRPGPIAFLVPRGARVTATVTAETTDGKTLAWQKSGDDLRKVATNPRSITLRTSDFAPQSR